MSKLTIMGDAVRTPLLGCVLSQDHPKVNELADAPDSSTIEQPQTRPAEQAPFTVCRRDLPAKMAYLVITILFTYYLKCILKLHCFSGMHPPVWGCRPEICVCKQKVKQLIY